MHIVIVGDKFTFPEGHAATNRVIAYAKGLISLNVTVEIICLSNEYNLGKNLYEGITYYHPLNQEQRSDNFIKRNFYKLKKNLNLVRLFFNLQVTNPVDAILIYSDRLWLTILLRITCLKFDSFLLKEYNEVLLNGFKDTLVNRVWRFLYTRLTYSLYDGYIVISTYLRDEVVKYMRTDVKMLIIPAITDTQKFGNHRNSSPFTYEYLLQSGTLNFGRDGIDLLIYAFALVHEKYPRIHLVLTGRFYPDQKLKTRLSELITTLGLTEMVAVQEDIPSQNITAYFQNAKVLISTRRSGSVVTQASFPTKLAEYLAAGRPVVASDVGDIRLYAQDGYNIFLVTPNDAGELAQKIEFVLTHPYLAEQVAKQGKILAQTVFNGEVQAPRMLQFIKALKS